SLLSLLFLSLFMIPRPPTSTLFPYTTLFRSLLDLRGDLVAIFLRLAADDHALHLRLACDVLRHPGVGPFSSRVEVWDLTPRPGEDRKSTRLNSSHVSISYAVFCLKKKKHRTT